jgi:superfamily I DNA/RNA helicase
MKTETKRGRWHAMKVLLRPVLATLGPLTLSLLFAAYSLPVRADTVTVFGTPGVDGAPGAPGQLLSGHKAKGLEWNTVYHLDPQRVPSPWAKTDEAIEQELNIRYVIETRSKQNLFFVKLENFTGDTE